MLLEMSAIWSVRCVTRHTEHGCEEEATAYRRVSGGQDHVQQRDIEDVLRRQFAKLLLLFGVDPVQNTVSSFQPLIFFLMTRAHHFSCTSARPASRRAWAVVTGKPRRA
jgi:hypothetical protein